MMECLSKKYLFSLFILLWLPCAAIAAEHPRLQEALAELSGTDWFGVYMLERKIGYASMQLTADTHRGEPAYSQKLDVFMQIESFGVEVSMGIRLEQVFAGAAPYAMRLYDSVQSVGGKEMMRVRLTPRENGYRAEITQAGQRREVDLEFEYTLPEMLAIELWLRDKPQPGTSVESREFDDQSLRLESIHTQVAKLEHTVADGVPLTYYTLEAMYKARELSLEMRVTDKGRPLTVELGNFMVMRLEPEEVAKDLDAPLDLFFEYQVPVDKPLGEAAKVERLQLSIRGVPEDLLHDAPGQQVRYAADSEVYRVEIDHRNGPRPSAGTEEIAEALEENTLYPTSHAKVEALAQEAVGDATTPREQVARLLAFVHDYIPDDYHATPVSVLQIIAERRGDCTEYSELFTTLARALKIPARTVTGLLYLGDEAGGFGHHA